MIIYCQLQGQRESQCHTHFGIKPWLRKINIVWSIHTYDNVCLKIHVYCFVLWWCVRVRLSFGLLGVKFL